MNQLSDDGDFKAFWPRGMRQVAVKDLAPRLKSLRGRRVALLWDYLFRGDEIFDIVEQQLHQQFPDMSFVGWREIDNIHGNDERKLVAALPGRLRAAGVDAVITAVAA